MARSKRRMSFQGLPVVIDRPKGTVQSGVDAKGKAWTRTYQTDYGFVPGTNGGDDEGLDVFVGKDADSPHAFWVSQRDALGNFDEYKLFVGYADAGQASAEYMRHIPAEYFGRIHEGTVQQVRAVLGMKPSVGRTLLRNLVPSRTMALDGHAHVRVECSGCGVVMRNCRCRKPPSAVRYELCAKCGGASMSDENKPDTLPTAEAGMAIHSCAIGIVLNQEGRILVVRHGWGWRAQAWCIPGGLRDLVASSTGPVPEEPEAAMRRELLEETGITVESCRAEGTLASPVDGRTVYVFVVTAWSGVPSPDGASRTPEKPEFAEQPNMAKGPTEIVEVAWVTKQELLDHAGDYLASVQELDRRGLLDGALAAPPVELGGAVTLDLGPGDVHVPGQGTFRKAPLPMAISAAKRDALPLNKFGWPEKRKYPLDTPARVRAAASYLEKEYKDGLVPKAVYPKIKAKIRAAEKKFGIGSGGKVAGGVAIRAHIPVGGNLHIRQVGMSSVIGGRVLAFPGLVDLRAQDGHGNAVTLADGPVWIQIAKPGKFEGHPSGPFEMGGDVFRQIVANFKATANQLVPIDFEHASEQDPTAGSIPSEGAPAQGWIKDLRIGGDGNLWGLVEWGGLAKSYIQQGKYKFFSPAIRFNSRDRVTGKPIGARLTSGALTNQPFLDGMAPLVARDFGEAGFGNPERLMVASDKGTAMAVYDDVAFQFAEMDDDDVDMSGMVHKPADYMAKLRACLSVNPNSPASEVRDRLEDLYDHLEAADYDDTATHEGVQLSGPCQTLAEIVAARPGDTWDKVFNVVRQLIAAAIGQHELEYHGEASPDDDDLEPELPALVPADDVDGPESDVDGMRASGGKTALNDTTSGRTPSSPIPQGEHVMTDPKDTKIEQLTAQVTELSAKVEALTGEKAVLASDKAAKDADATKLADQVKTLTTAAAESELTIKDLKGQIGTKDTELATLRDEAATRKKADESARVDDAFETYKAKKSLTDEDKEGMLIILRNDAAKFDKMYPPVPRSERHLLADLTGGRKPNDDGSLPSAAGEGAGASGPQGGADVPSITLSFADVVKAYMAKGHSLDIAQQLADSDRRRAKRGS